MLTLLSVVEEEDKTIKTYVNESGCTIITKRPKLSLEEYNRRLENVKIACGKLMKAKFDIEGWD